MYDWICIAGSCLHYCEKSILVTIKKKKIFQNGPSNPQFGRWVMKQRENAPTQQDNACCCVPLTLIKHHIYIIIYRVSNFTLINQLLILCLFHLLLFVYNWGFPLSHNLTSLSIQNKSINLVLLAVWHKIYALVCV